MTRRHHSIALIRAVGVLLAALVATLAAAPSSPAGAAADPEQWLGGCEAVWAEAAIEGRESVDGFHVAAVADGSQRSSTWLGNEYSERVQAIFDPMRIPASAGEARFVVTGTDGRRATRVDDPAATWRIMWGSSITRLDVVVDDAALRDGCIVSLFFAEQPGARLLINPRTEREWEHVVDAASGAYHVDLELRRPADQVSDPVDLGAAGPIDVILGCETVAPALPGCDEIGEASYVPAGAAGRSSIVHHTGDADLDASYGRAWAHAVFRATRAAAGAGDAARAPVDPLDEGVAIAAPPQLALVGDVVDAYTTWDGVRVDLEDPSDGWLAANPEFAVAASIYDLVDGSGPPRPPGAIGAPPSSVRVTSVDSEAGAPLRILAGTFGPTGQRDDPTCDGAHFVDGRGERVARSVAFMAARSPHVPEHACLAIVGSEHDDLDESALSLQAGDASIEDDDGIALGARHVADAFERAGARSARRGDAFGQPTIDDFRAELLRDPADPHFEVDRAELDAVLVNVRRALEQQAAPELTDDTVRVELDRGRGSDIRMVLVSTDPALRAPVVRLATSTSTGAFAFRPALDTRGLDDRDGWHLVVLERDHVIARSRGPVPVSAVRAWHAGRGSAPSWDLDTTELQPITFASVLDARPSEDQSARSDSTSSRNPNESRRAVEAWAEREISRREARGAAVLVTLVVLALAAAGGAVLHARRSGRRWPIGPFDDEAGDLASIRIALAAWGAILAVVLLLRPVDLPGIPGSGLLDVSTSTLGYTHAAIAVLLLAYPIVLYLALVRSRRGTWAIGVLIIGAVGLPALAGYSLIEASMSRPPEINGGAETTFVVLAIAATIGIALERLSLRTNRREDGRARRPASWRRDVPPALVAGAAFISGILIATIAAGDYPGTLSRGVLVAIPIAGALATLVERRFARSYWRAAGTGVLVMLVVAIGMRFGISWSDRCGSSAYLSTLDNACAWIGEPYFSGPLIEPRWPESLAAVLLVLAAAAGVRVPSLGRHLSIIAVATALFIASLAIVVRDPEPCKYASYGAEETCLGATGMDE